MLNKSVLFICFEREFVHGKIDDKKSNINEWAAKGGIAIRCKDGNVDHVIEKLKELGYE